MTRQLPPLGWLRAFEAAARLRSFTDAARELHVTQSAVSQQIRALEQHLGEALFHRHPRSIALTDAGAMYRESVSEALDRVASATEEIFGGGRGGEAVSLKANTGFLLRWLTPRLPRFQARHPEVALRLINANWQVDYVWAATDLEIRHGTGGWPGVKAERLFDDSLFPACHPKLAARVKRPEDLKDEVLIDSIGNSEGWRHWLKSLPKSAGGQPNPTPDFTPNILTVDTAAVALALAESGAGLALMRRALWPPQESPSGTEGTLVAPFDHVLPASDNYYLVTREEAPLSNAAAKLYHWILQEAESQNAA